MTDEIDEFIGQDPSNYNNGNNDSSKNTKHAKFINFFVNNRSGNFEQLTTMLKIIYVNFNNVKNEINESIGQDPGNHSNSNGSSSIRRPQFISFFVNNRSGHSK